MALPQTPMALTTSRPQAEAILAAMADVAALGGDPSAADRTALAAAAHWIFGLGTGLDPAGLPPAGPEQLARALADPGQRRTAAAFLTVMAFLDGALDPTRLRRVLAYAEALAVRAPFIDEVAALAAGRLEEALAHMVRDNLTSISGREWRDGAAAAAWLQPYRGAGADPALARRYRALEQLPAGSFGRAFLAHFDANGYGLPGEERALQERFAVPHDSCHVLAGYGTTPAGEILVSTFTAAMHPSRAISGHILPVILSWHLGIRLNDVAGAAVGALDPGQFWRAWARGERMAVDLFDPSWDFWAWVDQPLEALRRRWLGEAAAGSPAGP